jgi:hypothetical protein
MTEWISPEEKRQREQAEREAEAERQRTKGKGKRTRKSKTSNGADAPPPQPPPRSEEDYGERAPHIDCDPLSLVNSGESIAAVMDILRNHPEWRGVLAFDRFSLHVTLRKLLPRTGPQRAPDRWTPTKMRDVDCTNALAWFHQLGLTKLKIGNLHSAMVAVATDNSFHPVLDYFERVCAGPAPAMSVSSNANLIDADLPSEADALSLWLTLGFGAADNELNRAIARAFMIAVVRRVRQPGCQQDYMPVLIGDQGEHKSTGLRILIGDNWFADRVPAISTKDAYIQLHGKLVIEWPEIETLGNAHKAFISASLDDFRAPYARISEQHRRTCSFCGTTNFANFVNDASGARRFWPVYVTTAGDRKWLAANRDLIWRLACEAETRDEVAWLNTPALQKAVRLRQDDAQQPDPWTEPIVEKAESFARAYEGQAEQFPGIAVNGAFLHSVFGGLTSENLSPKDLERATKCLMRGDWRRGTGRSYKRWFPPGHTARNGIMSAATYELIVRCLLPGRSVTDSQLIDALHAMTSLKVELASDEEPITADVTNGLQ